MKARIRKVLRALHLEGLAIRLLPVIKRSLWPARKLGGIDRRISKRYLSANQTRKLHIGCGNHILAGWLNADFYPLSFGICHLDAARVLPFNNEEFDYIFSEHMIEHIAYPQGMKMLSECHRILKRNGKIRLSTPDLAFLIGLHSEEKSSLQEAYIRWASDEIIKTAPGYDSAFVINNFVRAWGHQFIYDEKTLSKALMTAGFTGVARRVLNESDENAFRNLENEKRMPAGFLRLETMTLEATKL